MVQHTCNKYYPCGRRSRQAVPDARVPNTVRCAVLRPKTRHAGRYPCIVESATWAAFVAPPVTSAPSWPVCQSPSVSPSVCQSPGRCTWSVEAAGRGSFSFSNISREERRRPFPVNARLQSGGRVSAYCAQRVGQWRIENSFCWRSGEHARAWGDPLQCIKRPLSSQRLSWKDAEFTKINTLLGGVNCNSQLPAAS